MAHDGLLFPVQAHSADDFFVRFAGLGMGFRRAFVENFVQFRVVDQLGVAGLNRLEGGDYGFGHVFLERAVALAGIRCSDFFMV